MRSSAWDLEVKVLDEPSHHRYRAQLPNGYSPCADHDHRSPERAVDHALELLSGLLKVEEAGG